MGAVRGVAAFSLRTIYNAGVRRWRKCVYGERSAMFMTTQVVGRLVFSAWCRLCSSGPDQDLGLLLPDVSRTRRTLVLSFVLWSTCVLGWVVPVQGAMPASGSTDSSCADAKECFEEALKYQKTPPQDLDSQRMLLRRVSEGFPETVWSKRARVRLALALLTTQPIEALDMFRNARADFPFLDDYMRYWIGEALYQSGDKQEAARMYQAILKEFPKSSLIEAVVFRAGLAWMEAGQCAQALPYLERAVSMYPDAPQAAETALKFGVCAEQEGQVDQARKTYREIWWRFPYSSESEIALARLQVLEPEKQDWRPTLEERYERGQRLYELAFFGKAIEDFQEVLKKGLAGEQQEKVRFRLGMAFVRLKRYGEAEKVFQDLVAKNSRYAGTATVWLAKSYLRQGKGQPLLKLSESVPPSLSPRQKSQVIWMCGIWLEDRGQLPEALSRFQQAASLAGPSYEKLESLWRMGWIYFQTHDYAKAAEIFDEMVGQANDRQWYTQALYWKARAFERSDRSADARQIYDDLVRQFPFTYYGLLARGQFDIQGDNQRKPIPPSPVDAEAAVSLSSPWQDDQQFQRAWELLQLGLHAESQKELLLAATAHASDTRALVDIIVLLTRARAYDQALLLVKRYFNDDVERGQSNPELWPAAYPPGHLTLIRTHSGETVDPFLVAGIIREESSFDPEALSRVGAVGLMQLMPETANRVAKEIGLAPVGREELFTEDLNIQLGARYVHKLLQEFRGNLIFTVAAYNAGPHIVRSWIEQFGQAEEDEQVELIPYRETRAYVKRVITSYRVYRYLSSTICWGYSLDRTC